MNFRLMEKNTGVPSNRTTPEAAAAIDCDRRSHQ